MLTPLVRYEERRTGVKENLTFIYDFRKTEEASEREKWETIKLKAQSGTLKINEIREEEGYDEIPEGNYLPNVTGAQKKDDDSEDSQRS